MNRKLLLLLVFFYCKCSAAQEKDGLAYIRDADDHITEFKNSSTLPGKIPFKDIVVYDYRYDSSKIGYIEDRRSPQPYSRIKMNTDWTTTLRNYFSTNLDPLSGHSLVMVIRSYWLQEGVLDEIVDKKVVLKSLTGKSDFGGTSYAKVDVYIKSDSLTPFFILDNAFAALLKFKTKSVEDYFFLPFDSIVKRSLAADIASITSKRKKMSLQDIQRIYTERYNLPVLKTPSTTRGIFRTIEDFKNNKPFITEFRVADGKLTDELYTINGKQESLLTDFWGFCDGKDLFIKVGFNIYKAVRQQNSFEVYGGKHISNYHESFGPHDVIKFNSMGVDKKILHLDMDSGKFY